MYRFVLWPSICFILESIPCAPDGNVCSAVAGGMLYRYVRSGYFVILFKSPVSLLTLGYWKWGIEFFSCCWIVYFLFHFCQFLLRVFSCSVTQCMHVYNAVFLLYWPFYCYKMSFFISSTIFYFSLFCLMLV